MNDDIERMLGDVRSGRSIDLDELEQIYTNGCAEVLALEADSMRLRRRLDALRDELRHLRTAVEWLQEENDSRRAAQ